MLLRQIVKFSFFGQINKTTFLKSIVYRTFTFVLTFLIAFLFIGNIQKALTLGLFDTFFKIFSYYYFDMVWKKFTKNKYQTCVIHLTGLSGSGKTTIANILHQKLKKKDIQSIVLDGDELRNVIKGTGFDKESRLKHIFSVGYIASLFEKQDIITITSLISPFEEARQQCRKMAKNFVEIYINTPIEECEKRDVKGLYKKARKGEIKDFTGIDSPYEPPTNPELIIITIDKKPEDCAEEILKYLRSRK